MQQSYTQQSYTLLLLVFMFLPKIKSKTNEEKYMQGIHIHPSRLTTLPLEVEVTVDETHIVHPSSNLDESVASLFPLIQ